MSNLDKFVKVGEIVAKLESRIERRCSNEELKRLANAAETMLELLVKAAPIDGLWLSDIEEWDEMIKEAQA